MEPVTLFKYDQFLAGIDPAGARAAGAKMDAKKQDYAPLMPADAGMKSKMTAMSAAENYNLAVGVYNGFVEAYRRVKPIPRTTAEIDFAGMLKAAGVTTAEGAVDHFAKRFLNVPLQDQRRAAVVAFLKQEAGADRLDFAGKNLDKALRQTVHLILSAPEYQLG